MLHRAPLIRVQIIRQFDQAHSGIVRSPADDTVVPTARSAKEADHLHARRDRGIRGERDRAVGVDRR